MQFSPRRKPRPMRENIVPMINVVFLLLIFFLMTAQIAPPHPIDVTPPASASTDQADNAATLYVSETGLLAYQDLRGDDVFAALQALDQDAPLLIRADAAASAQNLAKLLPRLAAAGIANVALITGADQ